MKTQMKSVAPVLLVLALASCVELTGQRISLRYDPAKDEIQILFFHDGIHESPPSRNEEGPKQIAEYVGNGDILLLDWPGSIQMNDIRARADDASAPPALRALCASFASSLRSTPVGRYRDPNGRVGAAQLLVISRAKEFVGKVNATISEAILLESTSSDSPWASTMKRMREGAQQGRAWLVLEGHSVRFTFPAHPAEWARNKAAFVKTILDGWQEAKEGKSNDNRPSFFLQLLAQSPLSIDESSEGVSIRLGDSKRPLPLRFAMRDVYNSKLEASVMAAVPADLDDALAHRILGGGEGKAGVGVEAVASWGPVEDSVRALLKRAAATDPVAKEPAIASLRRLAEVWNREGSLPRAPEPIDSAERYLDAWREWYRGIIAFPTGE